MRLRYGLCGDFKIVGDEVEALAELTTSIVGYEVTNNICNSITDAGLRETVTSSVKNNINVLANSLAKHTWHNASTTAQALRHSTEKQVKHIVLPLKQQKKIIYENIVESVDSLVRQFVSEAVAKICKPFLVSASVPVAKAYAAAVQSWYKYVVQTIERNKEEYFAMDGDGGGGVSSSFSAFVDKMHIDLDCEWVSMFGDKQNLNFNDPQVTNAKSPASMTPDSQSDPPVERRETVSSCVNNAIMTRCNPEHVLHESKSVLALLREYNGPFDKIQHVFSASFTAKDVVNCIEKQVRMYCDVFNK